MTSSRCNPGCFALALLLPILAGLAGCQAHSRAFTFASVVDVTLQRNGSVRLTGADVRNAEAVWASLTRSMAHDPATKAFLQKELGGAAVVIQHTSDVGGLRVPEGGGIVVGFADVPLQEDPITFTQVQPTAGGREARCRRSIAIGWAGDLPPRVHLVDDEIVPAQLYRRAALDYLSRHLAGWKVVMTSTDR